MGLRLFKSWAQTLPHMLWWWHLILRRLPPFLDTVLSSMCVCECNIYVANKSILLSCLPHFVVSLHLIMNQVQFDDLILRDANKYSKNKAFGCRKGQHPRDNRTYWLHWRMARGWEEVQKCGIMIKITLLGFWGLWEFSALRSHSWRRSTCWGHQECHSSLLSLLALV